MDTPPEVSAWIGHKFTLLVKILSSKSINTIDPSFEVVLIKQKFGKQPTIPTVSRDDGLSMRASSTKFQAEEELPLLVPIGSKKSRAGIHNILFSYQLLRFFPQYNTHTMNHIGFIFTT
jgi:replication factor A1